MVVTLQYIVLFVIAMALVAITLIMDAANWAVKSKSTLLIRNIFGLALVGLIIWLAVISFPITLTLLVFWTGFLALVDLMFFYRRRKALGKAHPLIIEYARSFFLVLLIVWAIRSFIVQPYRVPTGSLEPTIVPGDFIAVNQFAYGIRFPIGNIKLFDVGEPKTGQIALFYYPKDPQVVFVKRVIGVPGDHIVYKNKTLYINGKEMQQTYLANAQDVEPAQGGNPGYILPMQLKLEDLQGIKHEIYLLPNGAYFKGVIDKDIDLVVPKGMYFMMGDNRDDSDDSRTWGFVPEANFIGKAVFIWMSWDPLNHTIRFNRIGKIGKNV